MKFNILTIFPQIFKNFNIFEGIIKKTILNKNIHINVIDLKKYKRNKRIDDKVYGSEHGQMYQADTIDKALKDIKAQPNFKLKNQKKIIIYMSPRGELLSYKNIQQFLQYNEITIICGRYEGIDQRIIDKYIIKELSIGEYILSGGELAAAVFIDALTRYLPNTINKKKSLNIETFSDSIKNNKEYPQFTTPQIWDNKKVPDIFLSGNHKNINLMQQYLSFDKKYTSLYLTYDLKDIKKIINFIIYNIEKKYLIKKIHPKIFLTGTLGSGKTTLIKSILKKYTNNNISSPTYTLINKYKQKYTNNYIYHIDLYRINNEDELYQLELNNILNSNNLVFIEWAEKIPQEFLKYINGDILYIDIKFIDEKTRQYNFNF